MKPLTEEDIEAPSPVPKSLDKNKMTCDWWAKKMKGLTHFKAETELKDGKIKKMSTSGAGKIRIEALETIAEVAGWKTDKIEHDLSGNLMTIAAQIFNKEKNGKSS